jgi:hypothetical protein
LDDSQIAELLAGPSLPLFVAAAFMICWVYNCAKKKSLTLFMILKHTRTWLLLIKILTTPAYCIWLE